MLIWPLMVITYNELDANLTSLIVIFRDRHIFFCFVSNQKYLSALGVKIKHEKLLYPGFNIFHINVS